MGLFGSYDNAGPGINPNAPKKKPFARYWELIWRNLGKLLYLNIIFTGFLIPLMLAMIFYATTRNPLTNAMCIFLLIVQAVILGPAMAGCTRVLRLIVLDKPFFLWDEFKKGFSRNFGASLLFFLIDAVVAAVITLNCIYVPQLVANDHSKLLYVCMVVSMTIGLVLLFMNYYLLPMQVATGLNKKSVFKNSFQLAFVSPKQCFLTFLINALALGLCILIVLLFPPIIFLLAFFPAAFIGFTTLFINYPVIQKYVINPYYEQTGEPNPEAEEVIPEEARVFTDRGGTETPIKKEKSKSRKHTIS